MIFLLYVQSIKDFEKVIYNRHAPQVCHFLCYTADHICANFGINTCFIYATTLYFISFSQTATKCHICRNYNKSVVLKLLSRRFCRDVSVCNCLHRMVVYRLGIYEPLTWQVPTQNYIYFTDTFLVAKDSQFLAYIPFFYPIYIFKTNLSQFICDFYMYLFFFKRCCYENVMIYYPHLLLSNSCSLIVHVHITIKGRSTIIVI